MKPPGICGVTFGPQFMHPRPQFESLFHDVAPVLFAWASVRVRPPLRARVDPEDLMQEIACRAFTAFHDFNPELAPFRAWIFGIAHRVLQEFLRSSVRGGGTIRSASGILRDLPASATTVSRRVARDEAVARFIAQIESLEDQDRKLVIYRGLEGLTHTEVATLLSLTPDATAKRWQRLRDTLSTSETGRALLAV